MARHKNLLLENQLCFALYTASNSVVRAYRTRLADIGLTYPQYLVLVVLWEKDGIAVNELAETLRLDSGTVSPILKRLERMGFLTRERSSEDERRVDIHLTKAGRDLQDDVSKVQKAVACQTGLGEKEFFDMREKLFKLADSVDDQEVAVAS